MIINLTRSVSLTELCRITAIGHTAYTAHRIDVTFSHEAMVGFATELLWMYDDIDDYKKFIISTHPLQTDPAPNQTLGFYLTPGSPEFVLKVNSLTGKMEDKGICENCKEINIRNPDTNLYYHLKAPSVEDIELVTLETYELSRKNIVSIRVLDDEGNDITPKYRTVILEIDRKGLGDLATMLLVWADNYETGSEYLLPRIGELGQGYNLGIILTQDSIFTKFRAHALGAAHDYDSRF